MEMINLMIKILHYIPAFDKGGIESLVMSLYKNIDHNNFQFYFLVENDISNTYKELISSYGGKVFIIPKMTHITKILKYFSELKSIFKNNSFDVFHCHSWETRPLPLMYAKRYNVKLIITHAHFVKFNTYKWGLVKKIFQNYGVLLSDVRLACSEEAATAVFGSKDYYVINNGIDLEHYKFNPNVRKLYRKNNGINDKCIVYINVGRLTKLKNQKFLIEVFKNIHEKNKNTRLYIIGDGEDKEELNLRINDYKLNSCVFILDDVFDVSNYLTMSDVFLFPSISEGLGIAYIEAQANQLYCFVSDGVPKNVTVLNTSEVIGLDKSADEWAEIICNVKLKNRSYDMNKVKLLDKYSIQSITQEYQNILLKELDLKERS